MLPVAPNLPEQHFTADKPNQKWASDITYLMTSEGWLYLAVIIDLYSRSVIDCSISNRMTSMKVETVQYESIMNRATMRQYIFEYIEIVYNKKRRCSALGYLSPERFEQSNVA